MEPLFTAEQLAEIKTYHSVRYVAVAVNTVVWPVALGAFAKYGAAPLYAWCERRTARSSKSDLGPVGRALGRVWRGPGWAPALLFGVALLTLLTAAYLPVDFYFGFVREHDFGLSTESVGQYLFGEAKEFALSGFAVSALAFGVYGLARRLEAWWWLVGAASAVLMLLATSVDPYRSRLHFEQAPLHDEVLRPRIDALMARAGVDVGDVLVEKTTEKTVRLQAYFAGQGATRTIVLNDALIAALTTDEVLAAVAHEAGHVHESRWLGRVGSVVTLFAFLWLVEWVFRRSARRGWFGVTERADIRTVPLVLVLFDLGVMLGAPLSGWQSRQRELAADAYAVSLTHDPTSFRSMLVKAARINKFDPDPPAWFVYRGLTHPPISERLAKLDRPPPP